MARTKFNLNFKAHSNRYVGPLENSTSR